MDADVEGCLLMGAEKGLGTHPVVVCEDLLVVIAAVLMADMEGDAFPEW